MKQKPLRARYENPEDFHWDQKHLFICAKEKGDQPCHEIQTNRSTDLVSFLQKPSSNFTFFILMKQLCLLDMHLEVYAGKLFVHFLLYIHRFRMI